MPTDLAHYIQQLRVVDTHEHMCKEHDWLVDGSGDVLADLFNHYVPADLVSAGAAPKAVERLTNATGGDIEQRWAEVEPAWRHIEHTGYGEVVRLIARHVYDIDEITPAALHAAQPKLDELRQPGGRLHLLRDRANLDHIQTDDSCWPCPPDESGPEFFFYDLSWRPFCNGDIDAAAIAEHAGVTVTNLASLDQAMGAIFEKYAPTAIAVKSQHAYVRTLQWSPRTAADVERALQTVLRDGQNTDWPTRLCIGDYCMARAAEHCARHHLPFKIHTGYYAGNNRMPVDYIRPGHLCPLLAQYPDTRFVLMHIGYPYGEELIALTKHYRNVYADLCWAWGINPHAAGEFVRSFIHAAPINKLFVFGGDVRTPTASFAYSLQMRSGLTAALEAEVADGRVTEAEAVHIASRVGRENQFDCFDVAGTTAAVNEQLSATAAT